MEYSDDEGDAPVPNVVSEYSFVDDNNEPVSFSELPLIWDDAERLEGRRKEIGLDGNTDNGLQKVFEQVVAWKFDNSSAKPEIFVLSKKNNWIKLLKPRKIFEKTIREILITVHSLHFLQRKPETSEKAFWDHLAKVFSRYEPRPSENDLIDHMNLIREAVKRDKILRTSKILVTFLQEKPEKKKIRDEELGTKTRSSFIVDDDVVENGEDGSEDEEEEFFESVCAICDNGGDLLCCEGKCMRSFHATEAAGSDSQCESLGFSDEQFRALANLTFECKNCQYKQHQCFICGELGSSDKLSGAQVFQCVNGTCGYFYHPHCVAKALHFKYGDEAKDLEGKIAAGETFMCPVHTCHVCKEPEDKNDPELQFAICRRCPRAYHRKCLPKEIAFEDDRDEDIEQRAWEGLMPSRILIYCLKHEIVPELATPVRDHIKFPDTDQKKKKETLDSVGGFKSLPMKRDAVEEATDKRVGVKRPQGTDKLFEGKKSAGSSTRKESSLMLRSLKKQKLENNSKVVLSKISAGKQTKNSGVKSKVSLGNQLFALYSKGSEPKGEISELNQRRKTGKPVTEKVEDNSLILDADSERRVLSILREAESSITFEDVTHKHQTPSTHACSSKHTIQNITLGKLEGAVEALRAALQKLEEGGNLEDAKAVCEPGLLNQIVKWKSKLKVFLAPFLYGARYTSFGRHFTKVEKLQLIIDKLHCYAKDGDMIVDFCCGANDFSCLMKEKLDQIGRNCGYKNYDIFPAKNDFNFEKRDWMTVRPSELPPGSQLIMGLNPPFGVNAGLANTFIEKALEFKPKLLILVAPQETLRLDERKRNPYDLVWEDNELLGGKSFYLPGSVDVNDKQLEDWNVNAPSLSLWSRPDWTVKHKKIALENGHLSGDQQGLFERDGPDCAPETHNIDRETCVVAGGFQDVKQHHEEAMVTANGAQVLGAQVLGHGTAGKESHMDHGHGAVVKETHISCGHGREQISETSQEVNEDNRKRRRGQDEKSSEERQSAPRRYLPSKSGSRSQGNHSYKRDEKSSVERRSLPRHSSPSRSQGNHLSRRDEKSSVERRSLPRHSPPSRSQGNHLSRRDEKYSEERRSLTCHSSPSKTGCRSQGNHLLKHTDLHLHTDLQREGHQRFDRNYSSGSQMHLQRGHGGYHGDGMGRRNSYGEEPFSSMEDRRARHDSDYGFVGAEEPFMGYNDHRNLNGYGSYANEINEEYGREANIRAQVRRYGHQDPDSFGHRESYFANAPSLFPPSYGQHGPAVNSVYDSTSAMQRYAPRLDELNHTRMNNMAPVQPYPGRSGVYSPAPRPEFQPDSLGFAAGPYRPYSHQSSSGWLNE